MEKELERAQIIENRTELLEQIRTIYNSLEKIKSLIDENKGYFSDKGEGLRIFMELADEKFHGFRTFFEDYAESLNIYANEFLFSTEHDDMIACMNMQPITY